MLNTSHVKVIEFGCEGGDYLVISSFSLYTPQNKDIVQESNQLLVRSKILKCTAFGAFYDEKVVELVTTLLFTATINGKFAFYRAQQILSKIIKRSSILASTSIAWQFKFTSIIKSMPCTFRRIVKSLFITVM